MLILTRRVGETVMIGNDVTVTVLGVKGNQVRIGVNAPRDIAVHREEIYERIKREEQGGGSSARPTATGLNGNGNGNGVMITTTTTTAAFGSHPARQQQHGPDGRFSHPFRPLAARDAIMASHALRPASGRLSFAALCTTERWPSGRRRSPAKGVWVKSPSRVRIPLSPPADSRNMRP